MSDTFIPLMTAPHSREGSPMFELKVLPQAEAKVAFEPLPQGAGGGQTAHACGKPSVTLQRQGEVVCGIRVECGCGQVIELACAY